MIVYDPPSAIHGENGAAPGVLSPPRGGFEVTLPVVVVGAGAGGCVAALAAREAGAEVVILERDAIPRGNTALSGGQIPAGGTRLQRAAGIEDSAEILADDLIAKAKGQCDIAMAHRIAAASALTIDWLVERHGLPLSCITDFRYPGHSRPHMHATPSRFGAELLDALLAAVARQAIDIVTSATVTHLFAEPGGGVRGVRLLRPSGAAEELGCCTLVLACNGFGGNRALLAEHIPDIVGAHYHGHEGNRGDAVLWGRELGASLKDMGAFQGHGAMCTPHMIQLGWPVITEGGIEVNGAGERFSNENAGYSEQARNVLRQPGGIAFAIWDARCDAVAMQMHSHQLCQQVGAIRRFGDTEDLARFIGCEVGTLAATLAHTADVVRGGTKCPWGRDFGAFPPLRPPFLAARVTGALFHTQGGLEVDLDGHVKRIDGTTIDNLFAVGGAARGLSGPSDWGYLSGSGLLLATSLGRLAGAAAAAHAATAPRHRTP
jgi:fumarate reductase flavoprotein subunit